MFDNYNPWKPKFKIGDLITLRHYASADDDPFGIILEVHESEEMGRYSEYTVYVQNEQVVKIVHQAWLGEVK